jgi:hypothetical protein
VARKKGEPVPVYNREAFFFSLAFLLLFLPRKKVKEIKKILQTEAMRDTPFLGVTRLKTFEVSSKIQKYDSLNPENQTFTKTLIFDFQIVA